MSYRLTFLFIGILVLLSLSIRLFRIAEPQRFYFDEVYHVVTAEAYANNNKAAYDPFAPAPMEGTAYDWLHPPLAKLIVAGSIKILGDNTFAWRLPSAIFGTLIVLATFLLAYVWFGAKTAVFASLVVAFENLNLVMSRITMNDVFVAFFIVASFIFVAFYAKKRGLKFLFLTNLFLGLAIASKWTGVYAIAIIWGYLLFNLAKEKKFGAFFFLTFFIPPIIYFASYLQFWLDGYKLSDFINLNKQIWWYQNRHDLEHDYGTTPVYCVPKGLDGPKTLCPWILDARGVYFSYEDYGDNKAGYIYALGNPLVYWLGFAAIVYLLIYRYRSKNVLLLLAAYFIFWVPWIFSPRIMFMYHYLPSLPFLSIALGVLLAKIYDGKFKAASIVVAFLIAVAFFYLYPISTGFPIQAENIERYMLFDSWR